MNNEPSVEGFIEFVKSQPRAKRINHNKGWDGCAVGDYLDQTGNNRGGAMDFAEAELHNLREYVPLGHRTYGEMSDDLLSHNL